MRIVYLCPDSGIPVLGHKGASVHVRSITEALQARGHEVLLLCAKLGAGNPVPGVGRVVEAGTGGADLEAETVRLLGTGSVDLVVERYSLESGGAGPLCAKAGVAHLLEVDAPIVLEAARHRNLGDVDARLRREEATFRSTRFVMVVSSELERYVRGVVPEADVTVVPNGVDVGRFGTGQPMDLGLAPGSIVIGFAGSMKSWHGVEDLLVASQGVLSRHAEAALALAGDGPRMPMIREQVASMGFDGRIRLLGALGHEQIPSFLRAVDIATAPYRPSSDFYFSPLKVLEYMASGCVSVYPEIGDLPDMVAGCGVGYGAGDVAQLEEALEALVTDAPMRRALGHGARRRAQAFTWDHVASCIEQIAHPQMASSL